MQQRQRSSRLQIDPKRKQRPPLSCLLASQLHWPGRTRADLQSPSALPVASFAAHKKSRSNPHTCGWVRRIHQKRRARTAPQFSTLELSLQLDIPELQVARATRNLHALFLTSQGDQEHTECSWEDNQNFAEKKVAWSNRSKTLIKGQKTSPSSFKERREREEPERGLRFKS